MAGACEAEGPNEKLAKGCVDVVVAAGAVVVPKAEVEGVDPKLKLVLAAGWVVVEPNKLVPVDAAGCVEPNKLVEVAGWVDPKEKAEG